MWVVPGEFRQEILQILAPIPEREEELDPDQLMVEVEASTTSASHVTMAAASSSPAVGDVGGGAAGSMSAPMMDTGLLAQSESNIRSGMYEETS